jgi:alpha-L-rhamnosidase
VRRFVDEGACAPLAAAARGTMADFPDGRWHGRWIWCGVPPIAARSPMQAQVDPAQAQRFVCLRRSVRLEDVPARVPARLTADSRYVLWVNGVEAARGPIRSNGRRLHYDLLDLAPLLRPGPNVLAVLARYYGFATPFWAPVPPTFQLGAGVFVFEARLGGDRWLVSDGAWKAHAPDAWAQQRPLGVGGMSPECHDARQLPARWRELDFDDSRWSDATTLSAIHIGFGGRHEPPSLPYGALLPRPIAPLGGARFVAHVASIARGEGMPLATDPVSQLKRDLEAVVAEPAPAVRAPDLAFVAQAGEVTVLTLDFGQVVAGTLLLDVEAAAGARIDLAAAELCRPGGAPDFDEMQAGFRYLARGADDRFETFDSIGLRYAALSVRAEGPFRLRSLSVQERLHPRGDGPFFACSDPRLEAIWKAGRRTVDLCSQDAYLDCPTREQRAWTGDSVVHQMVDFATNTDWRLAIHDVSLVASPRPDGMLPMAAAGDVEGQDPTFIPDWALHWIRALRNLWLHTGDRAAVGRLLPVAENVLRWFEPYRGADGLLRDVTGWVIIDWSSVSVAGCSSVLNALWARALLDFGEMSTWLGDAGRAVWARDRHRSVSDAFELFWDERRQCYVDHVVEGLRRPETSQHAQATPIVAGLVPQGRLARLVEAMTDESALVHATWSRAQGDARTPREGERGIAGPYLVLGPPEPWWDVERQMVRAQPFYRYVVHDALCVAGREDLLPEQCLAWTALLDRCERSLSETWYGGTTSHAWSATPTRDLSTRTLGVTPAEPGFAVARVAPRLGPLAWARGAVPTPRGLLHVAVDAEHVSLESPIPVDLDLGDGRVRRLPPGAHRTARA